MSALKDKKVHVRLGLDYLVTPTDIEQYKNLGYLVLRQVVPEDELQAIEATFDGFISGVYAQRMGRDFCDMSQPYDTPFEKFQLVNAMLPSQYEPALAQCNYIKVAQKLAAQLYAQGRPELDYDQFLAKRPRQTKAEFAMHQDLGYWPKTANTWTATFSLALSDSAIENGCLQVIPGSNKEPTLRKHMPKDYGANASTENNIIREDSHTLVIQASAGDQIKYLPVKRGDLTIHDERIVHGSGGNASDNWRKTYVLAYRDEQTIREERALGFTHSHNDKIDWNTVVKY